MEKRKQRYSSPAAGRRGETACRGYCFTVKTEPLTFTKDLPGRTSAVRVAEIRPQVSGIVVKRLFKEGGNVSAGQQLYQIDPAPFSGSL
ncbi:MAG: biotin/lipoyl-binding protein [Geovibrio sp.]|nr:biotin/lipoyl-binding protein [Geovibrio sp.]